MGMRQGVLCCFDLLYGAMPTQWQPHPQTQTHTIEMKMISIMFQIKRLYLQVTLRKVRNGPNDEAQYKICVKQI